MGLTTLCCTRKDLQWYLKQRKKTKEKIDFKTNSYEECLDLRIEMEKITK
jgi:hypothetical protein